jgi:hypothetical protein
MMNKCVFVACTLRELHVGIVQYSCMLLKAGLQGMAQVTGSMLQTGLAQPYADLDGSQVDVTSS